MTFQIEETAEDIQNMQAKIDWSLMHNRGQFANKMTKLEAAAIQIYAALCKSEHMNFSQTFQEDLVVYAAQQACRLLDEVHKRT